MVPYIIDPFGRDYELREGVDHSVGVEDCVEGLVFGSAKGEDAGLDGKPLRDRGGLEDADELFLGTGGTVQEIPSSRETSLFEKSIEVFNQKHEFTKTESPVDCFPIETPDDAVGAGTVSERGEVGGDEGRLSPVEKPGGKTVVFADDHDFPEVFAVLREEGFGVTDEVAEQMFFKVRFRVRRFEAAKSIEAGEKTLIEVGDTAENGGITEAAAGAIWLMRSDLVEEVAEAPDGNRVQRISLVTPTGL